MSIPEPPTAYVNGVVGDALASEAAVRVGDLLDAEGHAATPDCCTAKTIEACLIQLVVPPLDWLPRLPEQYRQRWVRLSTLHEARSLTEPAFVKPPNDKSFPAAVYRAADLPRARIGVAEHRQTPRPLRILYGSLGNPTDLKNAAMPA